MQQQYTCSHQRAYANSQWHALIHPEWVKSRLSILQQIKLQQVWTNWSWTTLSKTFESTGRMEIGRIFVNSILPLDFCNYIYNMLSKLRKYARVNTVIYNSSNKSSKRKGMNLNKPDRNIVSTRCLFSIQTRNNWSNKFFRNSVEVECRCRQSNERK